MRDEVSMRTVMLEGAEAPRFYISRLSNVLENLALEEYLYDSFTPGELYFLVYADDDAVVLGRHQNPWIECPVGALKAAGTPIARRISGGGTVFHDRGNLTFSFITEKKYFDKERNLAFVRNALLRLGIEGAISPRGDILVAGRKISGNAQCFRKEKALHHGTLLVRTDTDRLRASLGFCGITIRTHAVASVPHPVANLAEFRPGLTVDEVIEALWNEFADNFTPVARSGPVTITELPSAAEELVLKNASWDWVYGHTPRFSVTLPIADDGSGSSLELEVSEGAVVSAVLTTAAARTDLTERLSGIRFSSGEIAERLRRSGIRDSEELAAAVAKERF